MPESQHSTFSKYQYDKTTPSEVYVSWDTRIAEYQQLRDAYSLCSGTVEAKMRVKRMRDKYAKELEAAGVNLAEVGEYIWHETEYSPPAALRNQWHRYGRKAILEDQS